MSEEIKSSISEKEIFSQLSEVAKQLMFQRFQSVLNKNLNIKVYRQLKLKKAQLLTLLTKQKKLSK
jgi:ribosomal protein L29